MLTTERERRICKKYGARDKDGFVNCSSCPLRVATYLSDIACKAMFHYDKKKKMWVHDHE